MRERHATHEYPKREKDSEATREIERDMQHASIQGRVRGGRERERQGGTEGDRDMQHKYPRKSEGGRERERQGGNEGDRDMQHK